MDPTEIKTAVDQAVSPVMTAFEQFKATNDARLVEIEKKGSADVLTTEKLGRIEADLAKYEGLNQKLTLMEQQTKAAKDATDRFETMLNRLPAGAKSREQEPAEYKSRVNTWCRAAFNAYAIGVPNLPEVERKVLEAVHAEHKALNVGTDTAGGYLAPIEYVREIIKGITLASPARGLVRVRSSSAKAVQIPVRTGQFAARRVSETGARTETTGLAYGLEELTMPEMYAVVDISGQMLEDSGFDMESEIRMEAEEQFAVKEGAEFVSGSGSGECEGILTKSGVAETNSGSSATIADVDGQANGLITLKHGVKAAYARNASWILNRTTIGSVRKLKDSAKQYIWQPGLANGVPNTIDGDPYVEMPDMPSEGVNLYPIAYGDFRRAYTLADRVAMEMLRDPYTQADSGLIRFRFRRRVGGKVTLAEAFRKLKCAA